MSFLNCFKNCVFFTFSFPLYNIRSADSHVSILNTSWKKYFIAIAAMVIMTRVSSYAGTSAWNVVSPDETTLTGALSATILNKTGTGVGIIAPTSTTNAVTTSVDIQGGTLQLNLTAANAFGSANAAIPITIRSGATLAASLSGGVVLTNPLIIGTDASATGTVTGLGWNGAGAQNVGPYAIILSGAISQPATDSANILALAGGGVITLSGTNNAGSHSLTGGVTVSTTGTNLCIGSTAAIPTTLASGINLAAGTILSTAASISPTVPSGVGIVLSGAASILPAASQTLTLNGAITGNYALTIGASGTAGTVVKFGGTNTNNALISVAGGTLELKSTGALTGSSSTVPSITLAASTILALNTASTPTFASNITCNSGATITATQAATLSGIIYNTGSTALTINGSAIATLTGNQYTNGTTQATFPITVGDTAGLKLDGITTRTTGAITLGAGTSFQATGNTTITNAITFG